MPTIASIGQESTALWSAHLASAIRPVTIELDANTDLLIPLDSSGRTTPTEGRSVLVVGLMVVSLSGGALTLQSGSNSTHALTYSFAANSGIHEAVRLESPTLSFNTEPGEALTVRSSQPLDGRIYIVEA